MYVLLYLFTSVTSIYVFDYREYWLIIPSLISLIAVDNFVQIKKVRYVVIIIMLIFGAELIYEDYSAVYDVEPIAVLNAKVEEGVWKGCYTSDTKKKEVAYIEDKIRSLTDEDDDVLFLDWASFAYLINEGRPCSPTSLDPLGYFYSGWEGSDVNYPIPLFDYFFVTKRIPNKIIYIDYKTDADLSIDDNGWKFNDFVNSYYELSEEESDDYFTVKCYELVRENEALNSLESLNKISQTIPWEPAY